MDYPPYAAIRQFYRMLGFNVARRSAHPDNPECEEELVLVKSVPPRSDAWTWGPTSLPQRSVSSGSRDDRSGYKGDQ